MEELIRASAALIVVLAIIFGMAWGLRRFSNSAGQRLNRASDLKIVEWRGMDSRHKLAVVQWDGREHLLCLGPGGDCLVAQRTAPVAPPDATLEQSTHTAPLTGGVPAQSPPIKPAMRFDDPATWPVRWPIKWPPGKNETKS